jgi:L-lactate dehydrogenase
MSLDGSPVMTTVGVIGAGRVGASCARAIVRDGLVTRLTIYDRTESYAEGEALDLTHALPMLQPCEIRGRPLTAVEPEDVLIMAFGGHTAAGQTRLDLAGANLAICHEVAGQVEVGGLPRVCLVATSPLDLLTEYLTRRWAGRMVDVIGSGTSLDTWRLRGELASICRVHPNSVHAWVVGEHGDSAVLLFSSARIAGLTLEEFSRQTGVDLSAERLATVADTVRTAAYRVRELKGSTWDAIGLAVAVLVRNIVRDHGRIVPVSVRVADRLCASLPCVLGPEGAGKPLRPRMDEQEAAAWERSLEVLRQALTVLP